MLTDSVKIDDLCLLKIVVIILKNICIFFTCGVIITSNNVVKPTIIFEIQEA